MSITWNDSVPIYRQLRERVVAMILDGALNEGDPLPSVRQVAADFQINPLTVSKAYQELVDDQLVEKRRGLGMDIQQIRVAQKGLASSLAAFQPFATIIDGDDDDCSKGS